MKEQQRRLTVRMTERTYKLLKKLATKDEKSLSVYVRHLIETQLSVEKTKQDEDLIRSYIRAEIEPLLNDFANRIIKISAKGSATSASSWLLLARTLEHFIDAEYQEEFNEVITTSRKAGQVFLAQRDSKLDEFLENNF